MPLFYCAAIFAFALDQWSKVWVRAHLATGEAQGFWPGQMHLEHVQNKGAAWGVLSGHKWLLIAFTLLVVGFIVRSARDVVARGKLAALGFGLILGGAGGNLFDRIVFGHVTDFFDLDTQFAVLKTFPVFNVADSALTIGVILMLASLLFTRPTAPEVTTENLAAS